MSNDFVVQALAWRWLRICRSLLGCSLSIFVVLLLQLFKYRDHKIADYLNEEIRHGDYGDADDDVDQGLLGFFCLVRVVGGGDIENAGIDQIEESDDTSDYCEDIGEMGDEILKSCVLRCQDRNLQIL